MMAVSTPCNNDAEPFDTLLMFVMHSLRWRSFDLQTLLRKQGPVLDHKVVEGEVEGEGEASL